MRLMLLCHRKNDFPLTASDPNDLNSELLSEDEENELISGLRDAGHEVTVMRDIRTVVRKWRWWKNRIDLIITRPTHGRDIERSIHAPAVLDVFSLPYLGSSPYVHGLLRNKLHSKLVASHAGVSTPAAFVVAGTNIIGNSNIPFPAIVKPIAESSSLGIDREKSIVTDIEEARARCRVIESDYHQPALVESFVPGLELEVPVAGDVKLRPLGVSAIAIAGRTISGTEILDAQTVYEDAYELTHVPAGVDLTAVTDAAARVALALGIRDYGRIDFRIDSAGVPQFIEANSLPHLQSNSSFYLGARESYKSYSEMLDALVKSAAQRYSSQN